MFLVLKRKASHFYFLRNIWGKLNFIKKTKIHLSPLTLKKTTQYIPQY